jgi:HAMP domain-containing protein
MRVLDFVRGLKLGTKFTLILVLFFVLSMAVSGVALLRQMTQVVQDAKSHEGLMLLHTMNAVRAYTSSQINPLLSPVMAQQNKFIPETVPAFSARSVFGQLRTDTGYQQYYYKEAAINPSAPQDRADNWETQVLLRFVNDRKLQEQSGFRTLNGQLVFYDARPMVVSAQSCLSCHTTPATAPPAMVERYGPINGFGWKLNDVVAAQIVYVPAAELYAQSRSTWATIMLISVASFALAVLAINLVLRRTVIRPVGQMAELARQISADQIDEMAPEKLAGVARRSDELGQMAQVFQRMAQEVYAREQSLKQQVQELRIEIDEAKKARQVAELVESESFQDLRLRAQKLRKQQGQQDQPEDSPDSNEGPVPPNAA